MTHPGKGKDARYYLIETLVNGYRYTPGDSDLDDEQPIHVRMTLGDWRLASWVLVNSGNLSDWKRGPVDPIQVECERLRGALETLRDIDGRECSDFEYLQRLKAFIDSVLKGGDEVA